MNNKCHFLILIVASMVFGCSVTPSTAYHRQCGQNEKNPSGTKITTRVVELEGLPNDFTFYIAPKEGSYVILLSPEDLLRYLRKHNDSPRFLTQLQTDIPLRTYIDLDKYRIADMIELGHIVQRWSPMYEIAEMLENGDASVIDTTNDQKRHGIVRKITVATVTNKYGTWRDFCVNDDDNFNKGSLIYEVTDEIVD